MNAKSAVKQTRRLVVLAVLAIWIGGCGPPQASPQNRQLIASLRTALSSPNPDWLEQNAKILEDRRAAGQASEAEFAAFQAIIAKAQEGQWKEAERQVMAFQKSPTADPRGVRSHRPARPAAASQNSWGSGSRETSVISELSRVRPPTFFASTTHWPPQRKLAPTTVSRPPAVTAPPVAAG